MSNDDIERLVDWQMSDSDAAKIQCELETKIRSYPQMHSLMLFMDTVRRLGL